MQGEDEAKPKQKDKKVNPSSATYLDSGAESITSVQRNYALAPHVQEQIGRRLAAVYDEILRQPVPDRFLLLLDQLDQATKTTKDELSPEDREIIDQPDQVDMEKERSSARETEIE